MTYADMFSKVKGMMMEADVSTVNEHLAYQFNVQEKQRESFMQR